MKKIFLSLVFVLMAFAGSAYKNLDKSIDESFMVQSLWGTYTKSYNGDGICFLLSAFPCKYQVTTLGKINIPNQPYYSLDDINSYIVNGWLWMEDGTTNRIYLGLNE